MKGVKAVPKIKYLELKDACDSNRALFKKYEGECRRFVKRFREGLVIYLGCPEDKVIWTRITKDESEEELRAKDVIEMTLGRDMSLYKDAFYGVVFRIALGSEWAELMFRVKKVDEYFIVKLGKKEHRVHEGEQEELDQLIDHVFNIAKEYYETIFENFIRGKPSTLGFKTGR